MKLQKHHRRSIRLKGFDYSRAGAYFVTIVTQHREIVFGEIVTGEMRLNDAGRMIEKWWLELNHKFPAVETDEYMVMPNHFHGVVVIVENADPAGADLRVGPELQPGEWGEHATWGEHAKSGAHAGAPLPTIIQWFKTMTTNEYIRGVKQLGWPPFPGKLWQRNYYEHIIRDELSLHRIRQYIVNNSTQWELDNENPMRANTQGANTQVRPDTP